MGVVVQRVIAVGKLVDPQLVESVHESSGDGRVGHDDPRFDRQLRGSEVGDVKAWIGQQLRVGLRRYHVHFAIDNLLEALYHFGSILLKLRHRGLAILASPDDVDDDLAQADDGPAYVRRAAAA